MNDRQPAERLIERALQTAREEGRKAAIPPHVGRAWDQVRSHILHDGKVDGDRFILEDFFNGLREDESELHRWRTERAEKAKHRYTVEQQADKSWAVFIGGGFVKGGFSTREAAAYYANCLITEAREFGVPVEMGVG